MPRLAIQQAFDRAVRHHQAGRLREAEQLYRRILFQHPKHAEAIHYLGVIEHQAGRNNIAVDLIRQSIALQPDDAQAHYNLGIALAESGRLVEAIAEYRRAIALRPGFADAYGNLANALRDMGDLDEAMTAYRQAIALNPNSPRAHSNLGNVLKDMGRTDEAVAAYRQAIAVDSRFADAHFNVGVVLNDTGKTAEAIAGFRQAIAIKPGFAEAHHSLGVALWRNGQADEAIAAYQQAIALRPGYAEALVNLGIALKDRGQLDEAIAVWHQAIVLRPDCAEALSNLGNALAEQGQLDEAIAAHRRAIALNAGLSEAYGNLANALRDAGQLDEAIAAWRQAVVVNPDNVEAHSALIATLPCHPDYDGQKIAGELRRWNRQHAEGLPRLTANETISSPCPEWAASEWRHPNNGNPDRRLRIGYVSPDFRDHVVGRNVLPLFRQHDRDQFEIICYSQVRRGDAMTAEFRKHADGWRDTAGLSDQQLAQQIREDRIDLLVDLALHTAGNRLLAFARKPAPVQVSFAGYPGSTGLTTIDYRLSDPFLDPPGMDKSIYSEQTVRLPDSFWCYDPLDAGDIPVNPLPALHNGFITFGCLNNFCKVNDRMLAIWAKVLRQVEKSRLLLLAKPGRHQKHTVERLEQEGIDPARIEFATPQPRRRYLELYHPIDLGLDSFPYNGHTTSLDSFWMGAPVVTLVGQTAFSRAGWCQLLNLGLTELAGQTPEQFVEIAVELACDLPRLADLRSILRERMERSPLMDAPRFARNIESAYRQMWRKWCEGCPHT